MTHKIGNIRAINEEPDDGSWIDAFTEQADAPLDLGPVVDQIRALKLEALEAEVLEAEQTAGRILARSSKHLPLANDPEDLWFEGAAS
ncbi:hypothetical protein GLP59_17100 [Sulfitobacter sp. M220]|uniref:hypothetical protein n=1 Tax=Sulfitobacter sp. M220 TaxID=2675333 RepID=UPI001F38D875|nr:hypothetical protein [Sulfitobacter sp. M220]MCF7779326.1 hypothetical protein [Sulfitobacter sp. M220]